MEQITYTLPVFEGPLDLLLNLIAKNKLNIYDIEISVLLEQYTEKIKEMQEAQIEIASEFLEMASRLVYIKSTMLLPKHEEEVEELKKELTGQLLEYQECKRIAKIMAGIINFDNFCREPSQVDYDMTYSRVHNPIVLQEAYVRAVGKGKKKLPPPSDAFKGIVARRIVPVGTKIVHVLRMLRRKGNCRYTQMFLESKDKSELVATFLAILELVKGKRIRVEGDGEDAEVILIERKS
ncbi:MAG: segregation/condensation protein A [Lachnospiraceae bacterium]|nr:segregation/condensation protein A [Lachnospiraceae bacterium]